MQRLCNLRCHHRRSLHHLRTDVVEVSKVHREVLNLCFTTSMHLLLKTRAATLHLEVAVKRCVLLLLLLLKISLFLKVLHLAIDGELLEQGEEDLVILADHQLRLRAEDRHEVNELAALDLYRRMESQ